MKELRKEPKELKEGEGRNEMKGGRNKRKEGTDESEGKKRSEGNRKEPKEVEGRNGMKGGSVTSKEKKRHISEALILAGNVTKYEKELHKVSKWVS